MGSAGSQGESANPQPRGPSPKERNRRPLRRERRLATDLRPYQPRRVLCRDRHKRQPIQECRCSRTHDGRAGHSGRSRSRPRPRSSRGHRCLHRMRPSHRLLLEEQGDQPRLINDRARLISDSNFFVTNIRYSISTREPEESEPL